MITKNEIIEEFFKNGEIHEIVKNITKTDNTLAEDLLQEIILILLEYDEKKIINLYNKKQLKYFITRITSHQWNSITSPFHYTYRKPFEHFEPITEELNNIAG